MIINVGYFTSNVGENFCDVDKKEVTKSEKGKMTRRKIGKLLK